MITDKHATNSIKKNYYTIWGALLLSLGTYAYVLFTLSKQWESPFDFTQHEFFYPLLGVSFIIALVSYFLPNLMEKNIRSNKPEDILKKLLTVNIIRWALVESIAVFGFVLSFLCQSMDAFLYFLIPSLCLFIIYRPKFG
jgi:hypothetical protein